MTSPDLASGTSVCPRCGAALRCGNIAGDGPCWCAQLPHIMPVPAARTALFTTAADQALASAALCFCPDCLQKITDERLNAS